MISVIIPVYNVEAYLSRCIDSIINNTYGDLEVICVDDGSPDGCGRIIDEYAERDRRVVAIHQENQGVAAARNEGLKNARGNYICFIDSDDYVPLNYFQVLIETLVNNNADLVIGRLKNVYDHSEAIGLIQDYSANPINRKYFLDRHIIRTRVLGRIYTKAFIGATRFPEDLNLGEDAIFNILLMSCKKDMVCYYLDRKIYYYYQRDNSAVHTSTAQDKLAKCRWVLKHFQEISDIDCKRLLIEESCKSLLNNRYYCRFQDDNEERMTECQMLGVHLQQIIKLKDLQFSWSDKAKYGLLIKFPSLYRLFRIISDPTMLEVERNAKRKVNDINIFNK